MSFCTAASFFFNCRDGFGVPYNVLAGRRGEGFANIPTCLRRVGT
jgi:hypothetical protein